MALKLGEKQLFCLKGEWPVQHMTTFFNKLWKDICFLRIGKFAHGLDIKCSFYWEQKSIFFISYHSTKNTHYTHFVKCSSFPKILQEKWIRGKRENEMMVSLELKRDTFYTMHSAMDELCPSLTPSVMVLGIRASGRYPGWHGILMVVPNDGISLSLFFSLILPLLPSLQPPHVRT